MSSVLVRGWGDNNAEKIEESVGWSGVVIMKDSVGIPLMLVCCLYLDLFFYLHLSSQLIN